MMDLEKILKDGIGIVILKDGFYFSYIDYINSSLRKGIIEESRNYKSYLYGLILKKVFIQKITKMRLSLDLNTTNQGV